MGYGRGLLVGEGDGEGSLAGGAFVEGEGAVVGAYDFLGEAEAEAESIDAAVSGGVTAVEAFEDEGLLVLGDSGSGIRDEEEDLVVGLGGESDLDGAVGLVIAEGVEEEVRDGLAEEGPVGGDEECGFCLQVDRDVGGFS
ncbi:MAG: hypothetical protein RI897_3104 [Verrucomicrobiota bacterium]